MAQMSWLRQKIGGYKLVAIKQYRDVSYMSQYEISQGWGVPMSYFYYINKRQKVVQKDVNGHWELKKVEDE